MTRPTDVDAPLAAVFLDAGGTLFCEVLSRAAIYAQVACARGLDVTEPTMRELMYRTHARLPRSFDGHFRYSEAWFARFIERIFVGALGLPESELAGAQRELLARFADPRTYRELPGALELVRALAARDVRVGVISNWSERLPELLEGLGFAPYLDFTLVSAVEACEKPEPEIFRRALAHADVDAAHALHAGNDVERDVQGARAVGILPVLIDARDEHGDAPAVRVRDLHQLQRWILQRLR